ncbi:MAG: portal protein, partial [Burkholderiales bacterium]
TASTELVALAPKAPFIGPVGAFITDAEKWNTANTRTHAYIEYDGSMAPERQAFAGPPAGALQEAMNAADDMKSVIGIYDAALGQRSNETSGVAVHNRKKESDVGTFHYIDNLNRAIRHGGCIVLDLYPHIYSAPRMARILGGPGNNQVEYVQLGPGGDSLGAGQNQQTGQVAQSEYQPTDKVYDISVGKYDVVMSAGPSYTTRREEAAKEMMDMVTAYPAIAPMIGDLLVQNLDWPGADEIAERIKQARDMEMGNSPQIQQLQQQLQQLMEQSQQQLQQGIQTVNELQRKLTEAQQNQALESRKLDIQAYEAETKRLSALSSGLNPEALKMTLLQTIAQSLVEKQITAPGSGGMPSGVPPIPLPNIPQPQPVMTNNPQVM